MENYAIKDEIILDGIFGLSVYSFINLLYCDIVIFTYCVSNFVLIY